MKTSKTELTVQQQEFVKTVKLRFFQHMERHNNVDWPDIENRIISNPEKIHTLIEMERTGGEPDIIGYDASSDKYIFCDCSEESPKGRRSLCYDKKALDERKEAKPKDSALEMANAMGIELLTEDQYKTLQELGNFDTKTSSWLKTPDKIRSLGGAIFGDRRFNTVFIYHNGADSYYASRGFRGIVKV